MQIVRALHLLGAEASVPNRKGTIPVFIAMHQGHEAAVRPLHSLDADMNSPTVGTGTPPISTWNGRKSVVVALRQSGAERRAR
jgi:hypothetical protein